MSHHSELDIDLRKQGAIVTFPPLPDGQYLDSRTMEVRTHPIEAEYEIVAAALPSTGENPMITEAQLIKQYQNPYFVEPDGQPSEQDEIEAINEAGFNVVDQIIIGWPGYNVIISVPDTDQDSEGQYDTTRYYLAHFTP